MNVPPEVLERARQARRITVLTGAGMSAESGVPTFRDAQTGLWAKYDPMTLATPEAWRADPALVWAWYLKRCAMLESVQPNDGHRALADWGRSTNLRIVTQNVDDLHERAGSEDVVHVHGSLRGTRCDTCRRPHAVEFTEPKSARVDPPECACGGLVRPGVVWFGEMLPRDAWSRAEEFSADCDLMLVVGTSALVYPSAGLPQVALAQGAFVAEVNPEETGLSDLVDVSWRGTAATCLPALLAALRN